MSTHIAESLPLAFPLPLCPLEHLDELPELLLIRSDGLPHTIQLGLDLVQLSPLNHGRVGGIRIELEAIRFVSLLGLKRVSN